MDERERKVSQGEREKMRCFFDDEKNKKEYFIIEIELPCLLNSEWYCSFVVNFVYNYNSS